MSFESRYKKLNGEQKDAVDTTEGPVMVIAGPGSGKTELLSLRVANILQKSDVHPANILCLTFTDAAAKNMRDRLSGLIGVSAHKVAIHTFHSFALDIAYRNRDDFYASREMKPADDIVQIETLGAILEKLPLKDALSKTTPEGFIYLRSVKDRIGKLKKAGITPQEYQHIMAANALCYEQIETVLLPIFDTRMSKKVLEQIPDALAKLENLSTSRLPINHISLLNYKHHLVETLNHAYEQSVEDNNSTKPLTAWKEEWFKKDADTNELHLKDMHQLERNLSLAQVYGVYQTIMHEKGYVDFDDMILDVIQALLSKDGLLSSLQEQYQYILVDEFQDTNDAQMRMIHLLTENPVHEGMPNIMVVGDDEQAIYKFQGAELNNILQFRQTYPKTKIITLTKNYRSTPAIVDFAQRVIAQSEDRLVTRMEDIEKQLEAANPDITEGTIVAHTFDTAAHEYAYIAQEIRAKLNAGYDPNDIAIIGRNHRQLEDIVPYLQADGIPLQYEKQRNVLDEAHIQELILLACLVHSLSTDSIYYQNELLPQVLSFPFWELERQTIWKLSIDAYNSRKTDKQMRWIDTMLESENPRLKHIAEWLLHLASRVPTHPLDTLLDELIGPPEETEHFTSPFRRFYFHKNQYESDPRNYLQFLSSLHTFVSTVRSYAMTATAPRLSDLVACVDVYQKHQLPIIDTSPYMSGTNAVTLLSAHKAKGLEFDTVFVINCQKDIWAKTQGRDMIAFPKNLPIDPAGETVDDFLRLFFVALTRAKRHLYVTSFLKNENGRDSLRVPFLEPTLFQDLPHRIESAHQALSLSHTVQALEKIVFPVVSPIALDEKIILKPLVEKYTMSVTHLNNFLDVTKGGPHYFFEQNLLRFPQAKSPSGSFGTAMHATLEAVYNQLKRDAKFPTLDGTLTFFEENLQKEKLAEEDFEKYLEKGKDALRVYMSVAKERMDATHLIETNFSTEHVVIDGVHIKGKIDKMVPDEENKLFDVYDFKTSAYQREWKATDEWKKIQLHNYKRQLVFYKLLVEGSRHYSSYQVKKGFLEFLLPTKKNEIVILPYEIAEEDVDRLKKLIVAVNTKIKDLDFPDVSKYDSSLNGIIQFEDDLIGGLDSVVEVVELDVGVERV